MSIRVMRVDDLQLVREALRDEVKIVALSGYTDKRFVTEMLRAIREGLVEA